MWNISYTDSDSNLHFIIYWTVTVHGSCVYTPVSENNVPPTPKNPHKHNRAQRTDGYQWGNTVCSFVSNLRSSSCGDGLWNWCILPPFLGHLFSESPVKLQEKTTKQSHVSSKSSKKKKKQYKKWKWGSWITTSICPCSLKDSLM